MLLYCLVLQESPKSAKLNNICACVLLGVLRNTKSRVQALTLTTLHLSPSLENKLSDKMLIRNLATFDSLIMPIIAHRDKTFNNFSHSPAYSLNNSEANENKVSKAIRRSPLPDRSSISKRLCRRCFVVVIVAVFVSSAWPFLGCLLRYLFYMRSISGKLDTIPFAKDKH